MNLRRKPPEVRREEPRPEEEKTKEVTFEILSKPVAREVIKSRMHHFVEAVHDRDVDTVVFLDKSARPFSWMFRRMWKGMYPDKQVPETKYVNIGTGEGTHHGNRFEQDPIKEHGPLEEGVLDGMFDDEWMGDEQLTDEQKAMARQETGLVEGVQEVFQDRFDGKDVLVVDEYVLGGTTLLQAHLLFQEAFPEAHVESTGLFVQDVVNREEDKHLSISAAESLFDDEEVFITDLVPWTQKDGYTGIFEPEGMGMVSAAANSENVSEYALHLERELKDYADEFYQALVEFAPDVDEVMTDVRGLAARMKRFVIPLRDGGASVHVLIEQILLDAEGLETWLTSLPTEPSEFDIRTLTELWQTMQSLENSIHAVPARLFQATRGEQGLDNKVERLADQAAIIANDLYDWQQNLFEDLPVATKKLEFLDRAEEGFNTNARQLRGEMKKLADEAIAQKS